MGLLYTDTKVFHFKDKLDSLSPDVQEIKPPIHIRIKPTNACVHNCSYCAYRAKNLQLGKDMNTKDFIPREKMLEIIDDIADMGVKAVTFSGGGDPFYYPHLLDAVKKLSKTNVKFASLTNGSRLEGEIAEIFAHNATWLRISLDGWDDESYMHYRNVPRGEWTKIMNNIKNFKKFGGKCYLGVVLVVDKHNASHVYECIKQIKEVGADSIKISPCVISNDYSENNAYHQPFFDKVKEQINKAVVELSGEDFEIYDTYHTLDGKFKKNYTWCPYLQILPVIGADLNVYSCQDKAYNLDDGIIGSIKEKRFKDFWFEGKEKFYKINPSLVCNHHCIANYKNTLIHEYINADKEHVGFV